MHADTQLKVVKFSELHKAGSFVMPNAWDAGSAKYLAALGFKAIGTTSAGIAFSLGYRDSDPRLPKELMFEAISRIVDAVSIPVSADLEAGFGNSTEDVCDTIARAMEIGCAGGSLEDVADYSESGKFTLFSREEAVERVRVARAKIDECGLPFVLTARTECFLTDHSSPLTEAIERLSAFREAGADCVFAPGVSKLEDIATIVREVGTPLNVLAAGPAASHTLDQFALIGVRRISTGSGIARATFAAIREAALEMKLQGSFSYVATAVSGDSLDTLFEAKTSAPQKENV